jgi:transposase-like protein
MDKIDALTYQEIAGMSDEQARTSLESLRWPDGPVCPRCASSNVLAVQGGRPGLYRCTDCRKAKKLDQFTVTVGTIFEDTHIGLAKWLQAFAMMCASKKGVSALQLQRQLGLGSYRSAWHMAHRIRHAMAFEGPGSPLAGIIEVDETYVGGKPRRKGRASKGKVGRGTSKAPVVAVVERDGRAEVRHIEPLNSGLIHKAITDNVDLDESALMTDEYRAYPAIGARFARGHKTVKHSAGEYARGEAHVNTAESFFALFKRGVHGAFHHISKKHLHRYCEEFEFRWDHRKTTDARRTVRALRQSEGCRLMLKDLFGKMAG